MSQAKKAFILLRVSSSGQTRRAGAEEGYSIEMQRDACNRKSDSLKAKVVKEWIAPAESASRGFYKTLREMIAALKLRDDIDYVIVYKLDRFSRDEHIEALRGTGLTVEHDPEGLMGRGLYIGTRGT